MTRHGFARVSPVGKLGLGLAITALGALALVGSAQASHIKGGTLVAEIVGDQASGEAAYYENLGGTPCTVGDPTDTRGFGIAVEGPGVSGFIDTEMLPAICPSNGNIGIWRSDFSANLNDVLGTAPPDGEYVFYLGDCCMVGGITNAPVIEEFEVAARVNKQTGQAGHSPKFGNEPRLGIPIGGEFFDSLAPSIPGGSGTFTPTSLAGTALGPDTDIVTYHPNSTLTIPGSTTSTMAVDDAYLYSVRVTHQATGNFSDRTVVLIAGLDDGLPPPPDPEPDPEPEPEPLSAPKLTVGKAKGLKGARGFTLDLICDRKCTIELAGHRALRQKTKEPNWSFEPARVDLDGGKATNLKVAFGKQLRRTIRRGLAKGINPIKFQVTARVDGRAETHVVPIRF
jgi:hypothetical protein